MKNNPCWGEKDGNGQPDREAARKVLCPIAREENLLSWVSYFLNLPFRGLEMWGSFEKTDVESRESADFYARSATDTFRAVGSFRGINRHRTDFYAIPAVNAAFFLKP